MNKEEFHVGCNYSYLFSGCNFEKVGMGLRSYVYGRSSSAPSVGAPTASTVSPIRVSIAVDFLVKVCIKIVPRFSFLLHPRGRRSVRNEIH